MLTPRNARHPQAAVRLLPAASLAGPEPKLLEAAFKQYRSLDWFDHQTVEIGDLHPQLLAAAAAASGAEL